MKTIRNLVVAAVLAVVASIAQPTAASEFMMCETAQYICEGSLPGVFTTYGGESCYYGTYHTSWSCIMNGEVVADNACDTGQSCVCYFFYWPCQYMT